ncbi:MAG: transglutaminase-like putative cysteine protease [Arenicella sp.]|jgi:transglutaminase-like putative cysteine protease
MESDLKSYLLPSDCINSDDPRIIKQTQTLVEGLNTDTERAIALYYFVRDSFYYNPYTASIEIETLRATHVLATGEGWCVSKAVLLAALCRAAGIPAKLGFADVVNHLSTEKLRQTMSTDVFYFHGYCSIYLNEKWVKATPAFNLSLCEKFKLLPLEFNGVDDSLYHRFDQEGNRHMEYIRERGEYLDVPIADMRAVFAEHYPDLQGETDSQGSTKASEHKNLATQWQDEVDQEMNLSTS